MISVSEADIVSVAAQLNLSLDQASKTFLRSTTSCNVQACPGSGKTTLLVAKLALLARNWRWGDRGILVLSHTNVARQEIESRLAHDSLASRLFAYPHFIGTIQGFVDRFIAFPYLRDVGINGVCIPDPRVDDEVFARRASRWFLAGWKTFPQARRYLQKTHDEGVSIVSRLSYTNASLDVDLQDIAGPDTATGQQLRVLKDGLAAAGLFRYRDMFAFARASLLRHPFVASALRDRFPWVFIDEVQDTDAEQQALIDDLFGSTCILQKLGDLNQAIFGGDNDERTATSVSSTPADAIDLPTSHRLAPTIAKFASSLAIVRPQTLIGNAARTDRRHTVFLFSDEEVGAVIPQFGNLILKEWQQLPERFVAKAVGFRRKPPDTPRVPGCVSDYWSPYRTDSRC